MKMQKEIKEKNKLGNDEKEKELGLGGLQKELEQCSKEKGEYLAGWQRARADFSNYKKEEIARVEEILKYANLDLIFKILPILDNFEIAERELPENLKVDENIKGVLHLKAQILDFLKNQGVEEIKSVNQKFDPNFHEAVEEIEKEKMESNIILEEIQKGYIMQDRVIRPAKVKVVK